MYTLGERRQIRHLRIAQPLPEHVTSFDSEEEASGAFPAAFAYEQASIPSPSSSASPVEMVWTPRDKMQQAEDAQASPGLREASATGVRP